MTTQESAPASMPRSVLRHRPLYTPDAVHEFVLLQSTPHRAKRRIPYAGVFSSLGGQAHPLAVVGVSMLVTFLLLWILQGIWAWGSIQLDTLRYGYPRTTQIDHNVGHEVGETQTHFQATNIGGQIYIVEIPGGNPAGSRLLLGPHLLGPGADLAPVSLLFRGDPRHPDLLIEVSSIQMHFRNTGRMYVISS